MMEVFKKLYKKMSTLEVFNFKFFFYFSTPNYHRIYRKNYFGGCWKFDKLKGERLTGNISMCGHDHLDDGSFLKFDVVLNNVPENLKLPSSPCGLQSIVMKLFLKIWAHIGLRLFLKIWRVLNMFSILKCDWLNMFFDEYSFSRLIFIKVKF